MIARFFLYSILKNLRFGDPFLVLYLRELGHSFALIGFALGAQHLASALLEVPLGVAADRWGRRLSLALGFLFYVAAFAAFATLSASGTWVLWVAVALFAVAEALRSGSHKAIILDYLDGSGRSDEATSVISRTRAASKSTSALAALGGGVMLHLSGHYEPLFVASALAAFGGFLLMLSYPRALEGEQHRERVAAPDTLPPTLGQRAAALWHRPGFKALLVQSALFEVQVKLTGKYFLQPLLQQGLAGFGLPVPGPGATWIGATEAARDGVGAVGARAGKRFELGAGGRRRALSHAYRVAMVLSLGAAWAAQAGALVLLVAMLLAMNFLQNARRPVFVAEYNRRVDRAQRASALSLESLARNALMTALLPVIGALADHFGLWVAFAVAFALMLPGSFLVPASADSTD